MGYVTREMINRAKEMDLLTYLQTYEPQELVHFGGSTYCTREHDSLKISNGKWCWFSRGIGGRTALDYLIKVKEVPFTEAVERIVGRAAERPPISYTCQQPKQTKTLLLPQASRCATHAVEYLHSRGIDYELIDFCIRTGRLYESYPYHNVVFVGKDKVRAWSDSNYDYTETSHFLVRRGGSVGFEHVPVDGSSKMPDDLMESIEPYDFSDAVNFQTAYLAGYLADKYDVDAQQSIERANARVKKSTEDAFAATVQGYDTVTTEHSSIQLHGGKAKYALYPVWLLNTTWNGNKYTFAMNGQTGKFVGDLPVDQAAARKWTLGLSAALSVAAYGVVWLLHLMGML